MRKLCACLPRCINTNQRKWTHPALFRVKRIKDYGKGKTAFFVTVSVLCTTWRTLQSHATSQFPPLLYANPKWTSWERRWKRIKIHDQGKKEMIRELGGVERKLKKRQHLREKSLVDRRAPPPPPSPANKSDVAHKTPISDAQLACVQDFAVATPERGLVSVACWCQRKKERKKTETRTFISEESKEQVNWTVKLQTLRKERKWWKSRSNVQIRSCKGGYLISNLARSRSANAANIPFHPIPCRFAPCGRHCRQATIWYTAVQNHAPRHLAIFVHWWRTKYQKVARIKLENRPAYLNIKLKEIQTCTNTLSQTKARFNSRTLLIQ